MGRSPLSKETVLQGVVAVIKQAEELKKLDELSTKDIVERLKVHFEAEDDELAEHKDWIKNESMRIVGQLDKATEVTPGLYVGSKWNAMDRDFLEEHNIRGIVNMTIECPNYFPEDFKYHNCKILDHAHENIEAHFRPCTDFIADVLSAGNACLVHCQMGISRSISIACAYLMVREHLSFNQALAKVKEKRPIAKPNDGFANQLIAFEASLGGGGGGGGTGAKEDDESLIGKPSSVTFGCLKQGFLIKEGAKVKSWKRRWFVLNAESLDYFKTQTDFKSRGSIPLESVTSLYMSDEKGRKHCIAIETPLRTYYACAEDSKSIFSWLNAIQDALAKSQGVARASVSEATSSQTGGRSRIATFGSSVTNTSRLTLPEHLSSILEEILLESSGDVNTVMTRALQCLADVLGLEPGAELLDATENAIAMMRVKDLKLKRHNSLMDLEGPLGNFEIEFSSIHLGDMVFDGSMSSVLNGYIGAKKVRVQRLKANDIRLKLKITNLAETLRKAGEVLSQLRHPNVSLLLGTCTQAPNLCLVWEHSSRGTLRDVLRRKENLAPFFLKICHGIASGLHFLHSRNPPIYHRNLRLETLAVEGDYNVRVTGFGLSEIQIKMESPCTYSPPEVVEGDAGNDKSDVFAFGVILFELMYSIDHPDAEFSKHAEDLIRKPLERGNSPHAPETWPKPLSDVVRACIKSKSHERPSFEHLLMMVDAIDNGEISDWVGMSRTGGGEGGGGGGDVGAAASGQ